MIDGRRCFIRRGKIWYHMRHSQMHRNMKQVTQIIRILQQGVTSPILCKTADGVEYCCKGVHAGFASLCKEWICANIAQALQLPIPEFEILDVPLRLFENWNKAKGGNAPRLVNSGCHYVFGSRIIGEVKDVLNAEELAFKKVDARTMCRILMFDRIIKNSDRNDGNSNLLMTSRRPPAVYIIDHNSAFDTNFDRDEFMRNHILRDFYSAVESEAKDGFRKDVMKLLSDGLIADVKSRMPDVWVDSLTDYDAKSLENADATIIKEVK